METALNERSECLAGLNAGAEEFLTNRSTMRFVEVNATACTRFGYTREELLQGSVALLSELTLCDGICRNRHRPGHCA
jgi:PAS domain-containing protein